MAKLKLQGDSERDASAAIAAGWHIDEDDWWTRKLRPGDLMIRDADHFGFTMPAPDNRVYVRSAAFALSYGRKKIPPFK